MSYKEIGMLKNGGLLKDTVSNVNVPYMDENRRSTYKVTIQNGILMWRGAPLSTVPRAWAYVMDKNGTIYCADKQDVQHHSAFLSGRPVAAAGHILVSNGVVQMINTKVAITSPLVNLCNSLSTNSKRTR